MPTIFQFVRRQPRTVGLCPRCGRKSTVRSERLRMGLHDPRRAKCPVCLMAAGIAVALIRGE